jgi:hypothetical protein
MMKIEVIPNYIVYYIHDLNLLNPVI